MIGFFSERKLVTSAGQSSFRFFSAQLFLITVLLFGAATPPSVLAQEENEIELAKRELEQQISHIGKIEKYVDRPDLARLYALKTTTQRALDSIQKNGLG